MSAGSLRNAMSCATANRSYCLKNSRKDATSASGARGACSESTNGNRPDNRDAKYERSLPYAATASAPPPATHLPTSAARNCLRLTMNSSAVDFAVSGCAPTAAHVTRSLIDIVSRR